MTGTRPTDETAPQAASTLELIEPSPPPSAIVVAHAPNIPVACSPLRGKPETGDSIRLTSLADLLAEPQVQTPWLIEGLLPQGGFSILAGKPKAGKSTLARCIALSVARGQSVIGRTCIAKPVIYVALEDMRHAVAEHFRHMGATDERIWLHAGPIRSRDSIDELYARIEETEAGLVVIDTVLRFVQVRNANDYAEMTNALAPLMYLSREADCHVMAIHHAGKNDRDDLDGVLGSVAFMGSVETGMMVRRNKQGRTLETDQRIGSNLPETLLTMDPVTQRVDAGPPMTVARGLEREEAIIEFLAGREPTSEDEIRSAIGGNTGATGEALRACVGSGRVRKSGAGKKGEPFRYSLPDARCQANP